MLRAFSFLSVFAPLEHEIKESIKAKRQKYLSSVFKVLLPD
jgi:hypothetical protein